jgi:iron(III) transport system ATP-binding protein
MNIYQLMPIMKKYENCPDCGSSTIGNGQGGIIVEDDTYTRFCKCGFKITINENGEEIKCK